MSAEDREKANWDGFDETTFERARQARDSKEWFGPPGTGPVEEAAPIQSAPIPQAPVVAGASATIDLQFRLANLYVQELAQNGAVFDQNYVLINKKELAKAYLEQHKVEFTQFYLAFEYAKEQGLDAAYVDQYPEQLAQNYVMGHALELAKDYLSKHRVALSEEHLLANQMDLAQSMVDEHQAELALKYVTECSEHLFAQREKAPARRMLPTLEMPVISEPPAAQEPAAQIPAAQPPAVQPPVAQPPVPPPPASSDGASGIPTVGLLTGMADVSSDSNNVTPMPRARQTTGERPKRPARPVSRPGAAARPTRTTTEQPAASRPAAPYSAPEVVSSPAQPPVQPQPQAPAASSYSAPTQEFAPPAQPSPPTQSFAAESSPAAYSSYQYSEAGESAASGSGDAGYEGYSASSTSSEGSDAGYATERNEQVTREQHVPPPLSGSYSGGNSKSIPWGQASQIPLSSDNFSEPPLSGGFGDAPWSNYQPSPPAGMQRLMSGLSESAMAAQSSKSLAAIVPSSLRSEGAAAEVTSAWF